jgi:hypothetical protein
MTQQYGSGKSVPIPIDELFPILTKLFGVMIDNGFVLFSGSHASTNAPQGLELVA